MADGKKKSRLEELDERVSRRKAPAAKPAAKPAENPSAQPVEQKVPSADGKKKVLNQNNAGTTKLPEAPGVGEPSRRQGVTAVTLDRKDERDERRFNRDRDEWNRQKRIQRLEELDRDWRRQQMKQGGSGRARFTTTFNGHRARTVGSWQSDRRTSTVERSPYASEINRLLNGGGTGGPGGSGAGAVEETRTMEWRPRDTAKDGARFGISDFYGRDNIGRSTRFEGGYLSADFRENFIQSRMEGLNPGDAGYDAMRRKAEGAWGQAVRQYDRQWQQYGQEKLREQSRLDYRQRQQSLLKSREEARAKEAAMQKEADGRLSRRASVVAGIQGYDRDARMTGSAITNREVEQAVAEAVRNSSMRTGVAAQITVGSGPLGIRAEGRTNGGSTTRLVNNLSGQSVIADMARGQSPSSGLKVGDSVGGVEMNAARREQDATVAQMGRNDVLWRNAPKMDNDTFELVTGMKREESRMSEGGRYAGGGRIVFGDQKTFDAVAAQSQQKRLRGVA